MELVRDIYSLETIIKPRSLQILDQAYDPSAFKFSQIIRYLQDQYSFHQELDVESYDPSTSPLPVDPKLAYDIHTGRYMRRFKTQGSTIIDHNAQGVIRLPYPPRIASKLHQRDTIDSLKVPHTRLHSKSVSPSNNIVHSTDSELKNSHNMLRKQVWRLPSNVSTFTPGKYKPPLKLPPITVSKLMNGI